MFFFVSFSYFYSSTTVTELNWIEYLFVKYKIDKKNQQKIFIQGISFFYITNEWFDFMGLLDRYSFKMGQFSPILLKQITNRWGIQITKILCRFFVCVPYHIWPISLQSKSK